MSSTINPNLLRVHRKNQEYFADASPEKYAEIKQSIEAGGIRDPLWILPDHTVIRGSQRLRIALELGLEKVPVEIKDVPPEEAEYLLIADNEERRQDDDPIRKARRAKFLAEYWGVRLGRGGNRGNQYTVPLTKMVNSKTAEDIAKTVGTDAPHLPRLLKLNDLIPELQALVSSGKLGTTAAEQLAYLSVETQRELYGAMGEAIGELTLKETKDLRGRAEDVARLQKELDNANTRAVDAEEALRESQTDLADLKEALEDTVKEATRDATRKEKEKVAKLESRISELSEKAKTLEQAKKDESAQVKELKNQLIEAKKKMAEATKEHDRELQKKLAEAQAEIEQLKQKLQTNPASKTELDRQIKEKEQQIRHLDREIACRRSAETFVRQMRETMTVLRDMELGLSRGDVSVSDFLASEELLYHAETLRRIANVMAGIQSSKVIQLRREQG